MKLSSLPEFFRKYCSNAEYKALIQAFTTAYQRTLAQKSLDVFTLNSQIDVNNLTNLIYKDFSEVYIYNITGLGLDAGERAYLLSLENTGIFDIDKLFSSTLYGCEHLSDSLVSPVLSLTNGVDYEYTEQDFNLDFIEPPFEIDFFTDIFTGVPYDTRNVFFPSSGRSLSLQRSLVYAEGASIYQDWYYKRLGILANMEEGTPPGVVLATYKAMKTGLTSSVLVSALNAIAGYPISLSDADKIIKVDATYIQTEKRTYNIPDYADLGRLRSVVKTGYVLTMCEEFFDIAEVDRSKTWYDDVDNATAWYMDSLPKELFTYVNRNTPVTHRMTESSPFWVGFPGIPVPMVPDETPTRADLIELNTNGDNDAFKQLVESNVADTVYDRILINPNRTLVQKILANHLLVVKLLANSFNVEDLFDTNVTWRDKVWARINATIPVWTYVIFNSYFEEETAEETMLDTDIAVESAYDIINTNVVGTAYGLQFTGGFLHTVPALVTTTPSTGVEMLLHLNALPVASTDIYFVGAGPLNDLIIRLTSTSLKLYYGAVLVKTFAYTGSLYISLLASGFDVTINGETVDTTGVVPEVNDTNFDLANVLISSAGNVNIESLGFGEL